MLVAPFIFVDGPAFIRACILSRNGDNARKINNGAKALNRRFIMKESVANVCNFSVGPFTQPRQQFPPPPETFSSLPHPI
jgi:hypothetical protein